MIFLVFLNGKIPKLYYKLLKEINIKLLLITKAYFLFGSIVHLWFLSLKIIIARIGLQYLIDE